MIVLDLLSTMTRIRLVPDPWVKTDVPWFPADLTPLRITNLDECLNDAALGSLHSRTPADDVGQDEQNRKPERIFDNRKSEGGVEMDPLNQPIVLDQESCCISDDP
ncbi:hypothetical protein ACVWY0_001338 [Arthrobacter sp. UYNi723]